MVGEVNFPEGYHGWPIPEWCTLEQALRWLTHQLPPLQDGEYAENYPRVLGERFARRESGRKDYGSTKPCFLNYDIEQKWRILLKHLSNRQIIFRGRFGSRLFSGDTCKINPDMSAYTIAIRDQFGYPVRVDIEVSVPGLFEAFPASEKPSETAASSPSPEEKSQPVRNGEEAEFLGWAQNIKRTYGCWPPEQTMKRKLGIPTWRGWAKDHRISRETVRNWVENHEMKNPRGSPPCSAQE